MKQIVFDPATFSGDKFAVRYAIAPDSFWAHGTTLHVPDSVPDNPIFDLPDESNDQKLAKPEVATLIADLNGGVGTNIERVVRCERALVKVLRYLRRESV